MKSKKKNAEKFVGITPKDYEELEDRHKKVLDIFSQTLGNHQTFKKGLIQTNAFGKSLTNKLFKKSLIKKASQALPASQYKFGRILDVGCGDEWS